MTRIEMIATGLAGALALTGFSFDAVALTRAEAKVAGDPTAIRSDLTPAQWREDLRYFATEMARRHGSAFHRVSKAEFDAAVASLDARVGSLDRDQIYVELDRLANMIGDGHTYVRTPPDPARLPIGLRVFGDDYRVTSVAPGYERALGARVIDIEGVPSDRAMALAMGVTPGDETLELRKDRTASFLTLGVFVHGLGVAPSRDSIRYRLQKDGEAPFDLELKALAPGPEPEWKPVFAAAPLYRRKPDAPFWCEPLAAAHALYCNFQAYNGLGEPTREMRRLIAQEKPKKLIIDLRLNGGGDFTQGLRHVVEPIAHDPALNHRGRLYVLIGRGTFSAAMSNAAHFRAKTEAILVGEPIGERPNTWQEPREMRLPNSHLIVRYSTRLYHFKDGGENLIAPDQMIAPTWAQYAAGEDPVLDWVLAQPVD